MRSAPRIERLERPERGAPAAAAVERRQERSMRRGAGIDAVERPVPRLRARTPREVETERPAPVEVYRNGDRRTLERRADRVETIERRNLRVAPPIRDRIGEVRAGEDLVEPTRPLPRVLDRDRRRNVSRTPAPGTEPPAPATALSRDAEPARHWRTDWRRDRRYDWHDYRRRHRSLFRLGFYYDPFGWSYRRYGIGWRLWPSYYRSSFWLHDPWMYRLPPAYGPYRWIRYWDDALLVNIHTGHVVDVIHNFFW